MPPTPSKLESVLELSDSNSNGDTALSSALRRGSVSSRYSVFAQRARNEAPDSGHAPFALPGAYGHTFHFGPKGTNPKETGDRSVIHAPTRSMQEIDRTPGCKEDAARSPRKRLPGSCKRCAPKFNKQK